MKGIRSEVFLSDAHWPDCDPKAWSLTLQIIKDIQPELIWVGGDFLDFKSVSKFLTNPKDKLTLRQDIESGKKALGQLRGVAPSAALVFRQGNHERRLQNFLFSKAPELAGLDELSLIKLLELAKFEISFKSGDDRTQVGKLWHIHGDEVPTGMIFPARQALAKIHDNVIFGHVHRFSVAYETSLGGTDHVAWSIGCIQNLKVDYSFHTAWTQGVALINYTPSGLFAVTPIHFFQDGARRKAIVNGKLFEA